MGTRESRRIAPAGGKAERFSSHDVEQIGFRSRDRGQIGASQTCATATFEQPRPEPAQWLHAPGAARKQRPPVDRASSRERQVKVSFNEPLLRDAFRTQFGPGYNQLPRCEQMPKQTTRSRAIARPSVGNGLQFVLGPVAYLCKLRQLHAGGPFLVLSDLCKQKQAPWRRIAILLAQSQDVAEQAFRSKRSGVAHQQRRGHRATSHAAADSPPGFRRSDRAGFAGGISDSSAGTWTVPMRLTSLNKSTVTMSLKLRAKGLGRRCGTRPHHTAFSCASHRSSSVISFLSDATACHTDRRKIFVKYAISPPVAQ